MSFKSRGAKRVHCRGANGCLNVVLFPRFLDLHLNSRQQFLFPYIYMNFFYPILYQPLEKSSLSSPKSIPIPTPLTRAPTPSHLLQIMLAQIMLARLMPFTDNLNSKSCNSIRLISSFLRFFDLCLHCRYRSFRAHEPDRATSKLPDEPGI